MQTPLFIDNCAWDVFFAAGVDLSQEFPRELFTLWITREAEFEIPPIKKPGLKDYIAIQVSLAEIKTHSYFGFYDESHAPEEQRVGGFDVGWFVSQQELDFIASQRSKVGESKKASTRLFKNEADISVASRSFHSVVLTTNFRQGQPLRAAMEQGGRVVFLNDFPTSGLSLCAYVKNRI